MIVSRIINEIPNLKFLVPAIEDEVMTAEKNLGVKFALDYRQYLLEFGVIWFAEHEFTGICKGKRLDVTRVTIDCKEINSFVPQDWYVIETLDIDGIIIWQSQSGQIYQTFPSGNKILIANNFREYIEKLSR